MIVNFLKSLVIIMLIISGMSANALRKELMPPNRKHPQKAELARKRAQYYWDKASEATKAGNDKLAALYKKCARNQETIAEGFEGKSNKKKMIDAQLECNEIKKKIQKLKLEAKDDKLKKREKNSWKKEVGYKARAQDYKKLAELDRKKAAEFRKKGDKQKAQYYQKLSAAKMKICKAYLSKDEDAIVKSKLDYEKLKAELEKAKKY